MFSNGAAKETGWSTERRVASSRRRVVQYTELYGRVLTPKVETLEVEVEYSRIS
jgi:hypothetical protein